VGGLGTIARIVADGEEIYKAPLRLEQALLRIERLYKPFHAGLSRLIEATLARFGYAILIDCHSMPSVSTTSGNGTRPDFVLGDRFGAACDNRLTRYTREVLTGMGYDVQLNRPYAGGFITEHYGQPARNVHALQIELNRALYLDEDTLEQTNGFATLRTDLEHLAEELIGQIPQWLEGRAAAE